MDAGGGDQGAGSPDFGPYHVRDLLGQGGMGVVHRAYDSARDRVVALKRLPGSVTDREYRARFQRESRIVAGLSHPNVIPVHDFGEIDGQLYLDMLLVEGIDLRRAMGVGAVDQDRALRILTQVAGALDAAHEHGLVHRDVKPANILIEFGDGTGNGDGGEHAYLADFGIARETSPEATVLTRSGELIGSWDYMAPERLSGGRVDGRSDQYSLACVLFECLTGRLPHAATDPAAKVAAHLLHPAPAPSVFVPTITPALDAVVLRGMAKDPARRFPSATALMTAAAEAAYSGATVRGASATAPGPVLVRDQATLVRAVMRSTAARRPATLVIPHDRPPTCPYPGLSGFEPADAELFHGRGHVVTDLLVRLAEQLDVGEPLVLVGASGAGKSSLLHAGLLPALDAADDAWPSIVLTPGANPVGALAAALADRSTIVAAEWERVVRETPGRFGSVCARSVVADRGRMVLVVDQFEELFTHGTPEADRAAFATALANARPALVVLAVRADLLDRCIELTPLIPALNSPVLLGSMDATELRQAIVSPARDSGVDVEPGLPERLIADLGVRGEVGYDPGALPRLAHALRETWNHRDGPVLTLAAYRRSGGIDGAVARTAEEIHSGLDPEGRRTLRTVLLRLVTVSDDGTVTRRRVDPHEFASGDGDPAVVDRLIAGRLVTVDATGARLSHEALLTAWPRLRDWVDEDRAGLVQRRRFGDAVRVWAESGKQPDDLYRGVRLAALGSWLGTVDDLGPDEREFLDRSNEAEHAEQLAARQRTRRLRGMVAALSLLLVLASVAGVVAFELRRTAQGERDRADAGRQLNLSRQLAAESALARVVDPRRAALGALGAARAGDTVEGRSALLGIAADGYRGRMSGHQGAVTSVAMSADGQVAVSGGRDGSLRLWSVPDRRQIAVLADGDGWYRTVSMSADGKLLAAVDVLKKTVQLWSVPDRKLVSAVPGELVEATLSADGRRIATFDETRVSIRDTATLAETAGFATTHATIMVLNADASLIATTGVKDVKEVEVHRTADGSPVAVLGEHTDDVTALAFDRAGTTLASASADGSVRLWDTARWTTRKVIKPDYEAHALVFGPTGSTLVTGGLGTTVAVWDAVTGSLLLQYSTGPTTVLGLALSGDGHTLLGSESGGAVTKWETGRRVFGTQQAALTGVAYQPGGTVFAATAGDGSVELWDSATGALVRKFKAHDAESTEAAFSPDGSALATVGADGAAVLWDVATGAELRRFTTPGAELSGVAFSPDGKSVAVSSRTPATAVKGTDLDELVVLSASDFSVVDRRSTRDEPRNPETNPIDPNYPLAAAFSPDGRTLATGLSGGKVALWNLVDPGSALTILQGHDGAAATVAFSPDGTTLATGGGDRLIRLWRVRDGVQVGELAGSDSTVRAVAYSPDGRTIASASQDTVMRLWDVPGRQQLARLERHWNDLNAVDFDDSGDRVASASADGTVLVWDVVPDHALRTVCGLLDRDTMAQDWQALGPDRGDPPTCPS